MRQRIENHMVISVSGIDLTTVSNIKFWVRQGSVLLEYAPTVVDSITMTVLIPKSDAMHLSKSDVKMQFAYTDSQGVPNASEVVTMTVDELLKESGYGTL